MNATDLVVDAVAPPASWLALPAYLDPGQAARLLALDPDELARRQQLRAAHVEAGRAWSSDIPATRDDGEYPRLALLVWAARLGLYPRKLHGHHVIGYAGIAERLGYRNGAYVRRLAMLARAEPDEGNQLPAPVVVLALPARRVVLFDWPREVRRWAIHTGRLAPDGVTPLVKRPRRGPARR